MTMNSWFDIKDMDIQKMNEENVDEIISLYDLKESSQNLQQIMNEEISLLDNKSQNLYVGGFSQGAALSLYAGLQYQQNIGGILCYSGFYVPNIQIHEQNINTPVLICHGLQDELLSWQSVEHYFNQLSFKKSNIEINTFPQLTHQMNFESFFVFKEFFNKAKYYNKDNK